MNIALNVVYRQELNGMNEDSHGQAVLSDIQKLVAEGAGGVARLVQMIDGLLKRLESQQIQSNSRGAAAATLYNYFITTYQPRSTISTIIKKS